MLKMQLIDTDSDHIMISADEPVRVEISHIGNGVMMVHAYQGIEIDQDQEPDLVYDGSVSNQMQDQTKGET